MLPRNAKYQVPPRPSARGSAVSKTPGACWGPSSLRRAAADGALGELVAQRGALGRGRHVHSPPPPFEKGLVSW